MRVQKKTAPFLAVQPDYIQRCQSEISQKKIPFWQRKKRRAFAGTDIFNFPCYKRSTTPTKNQGKASILNTCDSPTPTIPHQFLIKTAR